MALILGKMMKSSSKAGCFPSDWKVVSSFHHLAERHGRVGQSSRQVQVRQWIPGDPTDRVAWHNGLLATGPTC